MTTFKPLIALIPLALALSACADENQKLDLGDDDTQGSTAQGLAAYEGTWDGYAEAYHFDQGSDRVRVTLDSDGNGTIRLGDAPEFAPFSNPAIGYPEEFSFTEYVPIYSAVYSNAHEGFSYPVLDARVESGRLRFNFWATDIVKAWCEAQTSYHDPSFMVDSDRYTCNPAGSSYAQDGSVCLNNDNEVADCGFVKTCDDGCTCDANGCTSFRREGQGLELDGLLQNDGDTLIGTLVVPWGDTPDRVIIHLTR